MSEENVRHGRMPNPHPVFFSEGLFPAFWLFSVLLTLLAYISEGALPIITAVNAINIAFLITFCVVIGCKDKSNLMKFEFGIELLADFM